MPSFDVVSKVDLHEVDNALNQANKELSQRFDFKGSQTKIDLTDGNFVLESADEYKVKAAFEVLQGKLAKRKVPLGALDTQPIEPATGGRARQKVVLKSGIDQETARTIVKAIKKTKLKVQGAIQGDIVRVSGKKRDDLQSIVQMIKEEVLP